MKKIIHEIMLDGVELRSQCVEQLDDVLIAAATLICASLRADGKILACGNGGSAADAQHFAGELVNRFEMNRPALAGIALTHDASVITSIANDFSFKDVFSRQIEAFGRSGDVLLAISTSGSSENVLAAVDAAARSNMRCIALTGRGGGALGQHPAVDVHICIPHASTPRIQEMHITCLHLICTLIDHQMFGASL